MARTWALELGSRGITTNVVAPGPIATKLFQEVHPEDDPETARLVQSTAVKRLGTPEDVANAVMYFVDPQNGFVTGQVLYVCGGSSVGAVVI